MRGGRGDATSAVIAAAGWAARLAVRRSTVGALRCHTCARQAPIQLPVMSSTMHGSMQYGAGQLYNRLVGPVLCCVFWPSVRSSRGRQWPWQQQTGALTNQAATAALAPTSQARRPSHRQINCREVVVALAPVAGCSNRREVPASRADAGTWTIARGRAGRGRGGRPSPRADGASTGSGSTIPPRRSANHLNTRSSASDGPALP